MSIFKRIFKVGEAHVNKAVDKMEKPEVMLEQAIRDQEKNIREARQKVQAVIATERQTKAQLNKEDEGRLMWEQRAEKALMAGDENLAAQALGRSEEYSGRANGLRPQWETQRQSVEGLKQSIQKMEDELNELKRNKDLIIAQSKAAQVKKQIYEAKAKIGKNNNSDLIARMKAKAERESYEAAAAEEMAEVESGKDSLDKQFAALESGPSQSAAVQDKLAAMKARLGK